MKMLTKIFSVALLLVAVLLLSAGSAQAVMYQYTDSEGNVHLTDNQDRIPAEYRNSAIAKQEKKHTDGYTPSFQEISDLPEQEREHLWFKVSEMSTFDRYRLILQAGATDVKGVVGGMKIQMAIAVFGYLVLMTVVFIKIKGSLRYMTAMMLTLCLGMVMMAIFVKGTILQGPKIIEKQNVIKAESAAQPVATPGNGLATEQGSILDRLDALQQMSDERQQLFQALMEEDKRKR